MEKTEDNFCFAEMNLKVCVNLAAFGGWQTLRESSLLCTFWESNEIFIYGLHAYLVLLYLPVLFLQKEEHWTILPGKTLSYLYHQ